MTFFSPPYTNPNKSASIPFNAMGVWRGTIMGVYDGPTVDVSVPRISGEYVYLNAEALVSSNGQGYTVGDTVYVSFIEGRPDDLLVLGPVFFGSAGGTTLGPWVDCELVDCDPYGVGARVRKDSNGIVYMFAELQMHDTGSDLFILPAGYEPITPFSVALFFRRVDDNTAGYGQITVGYGGNGVSLTDHSGDPLGEFTQVCFGGIAYPTT